MTATEAYPAPSRALRAAQASQGRAVPLRIRLALRDCVDALDRALESPQNLFEKSNALAEVQEGLDELWEYRDFREEQFGDLVNHLQLLFKGVHRIDVPAEHVEAIRAVLVGIEGRQKLTDPDVRELEAHLVAKGVDVLRGLE